MVKYVFVPQ